MNCIFSKIVGNILHGRWESQNKQFQFTDGVEVRNEAGVIIPLSGILEGDEVQMSGQPATLITVRRSEQGIQEKAREDADRARTEGHDGSVHGTGKGRQFGPVTTSANPHPAPSPSSADLPPHGGTHLGQTDAAQKADNEARNADIAAENERLRKKGIK